MITAVLAVVREGLYTLPYCAHDPYGQYLKISNFSMYFCLLRGREKQFRLKMHLHTLFYVDLGSKAKRLYVNVSRYPDPK